MINMVLPWCALLAAGWLSSATGFIVTPSAGTLHSSLPSARLLSRTGLTGPSSPVVAEGSSSSSTTTRMTTTTTPGGVSMKIVSPREAVVEVSLVDPDARSSYSIKWFEESNPSVFDQTTASLRSKVLLSNLSPKTDYVALVRRPGATGGGDVERVTFSTPEAEGNPSGEMTELSRLEIRVGKCLEIKKHPDADTLYVETIDFGEKEPRTIVSGLVGYVSEDEMCGRMVLGLCNLPPRSMRGVDSAGMLLCASNDEHTSVDPLSPPEGSKVGELITFQGVLSAPTPPGSSAARAWSAVVEGMKTAAGEDGGVGIGGWNGIPMETSSGPCTSSITGRVR